MDYERIQAASRRLSELEINIDIDGCDIIVNWFRCMVKNGDWKIARHSHSSFEFHFIAEGDCTVQTDSDEFHVSEGEFYLAPPNVHHAQFQYLSDTCVEYSLDVEFRRRREASCSEMSLICDFFSKARCRPYRDDQGIIRLFKSSLEEAYNRNPCSFVVVNSHVLGILGLTARAMGYGEPGANAQDRNENGHSRMDLIAGFVHDNIHNSISPSDIASFMNLSEKQVSRIVLASEGFSTKKYITNSKLDEAKRLLLSTDMSVSSISRTLSFSSPSYFVNVFTRNEGLSPGSFRSTKHGGPQNQNTTLSKNCNSK